MNHLPVAEVLIEILLDVTNNTVFRTSSSFASAVVASEAVLYVPKTHHYLGNYHFEQYLFRLGSIWSTQ